MLDINQWLLIGTCSVVGRGTTAYWVSSIFGSQWSWWGVRRLFGGFGGVGYYRGSPEAIDHRYCQMSEAPFNEVGGHDLLAVTPPRTGLSLPIGTQSSHNIILIAYKWPLTGVHQLNWIDKVEIGLVQLYSLPRRLQGRFVSSDWRICFNVLANAGIPGPLTISFDIKFCMKSSLYTNAHLVEYK